MFFKDRIERNVVGLEVGRVGGHIKRWSPARKSLFSFSIVFFSIVTHIILMT